ncbi:dTMP kinase [unidentified bacterial endosymbiont]|uniref:dTMP kinase n=1 Tax=unidentified bacterial endosymbiont TaxID=2355 RepID=UPI0020A0527A|nr:dTMP kinase [unidentified bacterial endosymbiont]
MKLGRFIVIEGLEGAGKSTVCGLVATALTQAGISEVLQTREPGGTQLGEQLRLLIQQGLPDEPLQATAELLLLYAARAQLVEQVIKPALARGAWVVGDRHDLSTQAYQGGGRGIAEQVLNSLRDAVLGPFRPDLTLYLDISPAKGLQRVAQRGSFDRMEQESLLFFQRVRARYLALATDDPQIVIVSAEHSRAQIAQQIQQIITTWLSRN